MLFSVHVSYLLAVLLELSGSFRRGTSLLFFYFFRRYIPIISLAGYHIPDPSSVSVLPVVKKNCHSFYTVVCPYASSILSCVVDE